MTAQGTRIGALETQSTAQAGQVVALQAGQAAQATQITALQNQQMTMAGQIGTLFDLSEYNRREVVRANEGVALALAMDAPGLPAGTSFAVSGGIGYFNERAAGTAAFTARVGRNASVSGGVGVGFSTGEVGARGDFQTAW